MEEIYKLFLDQRHPKEVDDYFHVFNTSNILNVIYWYELFQKILNIQGDIVECGVGRGRSLITLSVLNNYFNLKLSDYPDRKIIGLDSFSGFPEPSIKDISFRNIKKGEWSCSPNKQFNYNLRNIKKILKNASGYNFNNSKNFLVKGFFNKTTKKLSVKKIVILHLDGDLYESIKEPLINLSKKIVIGGIIVIDDYITESAQDAWPGARKAVEEFLDTNKKFKLKQSLKGSPYLIRIK